MSLKQKRKASVMVSETDRQAIELINTTILEIASLILYKVESPWANILHFATYYTHWPTLIHTYIHTYT